MQVAREKWGSQIDTASPICLEYNHSRRDWCLGYGESYEANCFLNQ